MLHIWTKLTSAEVDRADGSKSLDGTVEACELVRREGEQGHDDDRNAGRGDRRRREDEALVAARPFDEEQPALGARLEEDAGDGLLLARTEGRDAEHAPRAAGEGDGEGRDGTSNTRLAPLARRTERGADESTDSSTQASATSAAAGESSSSKCRSSGGSSARQTSSSVRTASVISAACARITRESQRASTASV